MKKVCKKCRLFVEGEVCPLCKGNQFAEGWKGRLFIKDAAQSEIAKNMGLQSKGEYAIKLK